MPRNTEIKLHLASEARLKCIEERIREALAVEFAPSSDTRDELLEQTDTYYTPAAAGVRLKLRQECHNGVNSERLIAYARAETEDARLSHYEMAELKERQGAAMIKVLGMALGAPEVVVSKRRHVYYMGQARIHLDTVAGLAEPHFLEIEVCLAEQQTHEWGQEYLRAVLASIGVTDEERDKGAFTCSYREVLLAARK